VLPRVRETGKNMGENSGIKNLNKVGQYSYEQDEVMFEESQKPVTESTEFELYFPTKICN